MNPFNIETYVQENFFQMIILEEIFWQILIVKLINLLKILDPIAVVS